MIEQTSKFAVYAMLRDRSSWPIILLIDLSRYVKVEANSLAKEELAITSNMRRLFQVRNLL